MFDKISKIIIGALIGVVLVALAWYLISGWSSSSSSELAIPEIKDDLLTNPAINNAQDRDSAIKYPVTVSDGETGVSDPF